MDYMLNHLILGKYKTFDEYANDMINIMSEFGLKHFNFCQEKIYKTNNSRRYAGLKPIRKVRVRR